MQFSSFIRSEWKDGMGWQWIIVTCTSLVSYIVALVSLGARYPWGILFGLLIGYTLTCQARLLQCQRKLISWMSLANSWQKLAEERVFSDLKDPNHTDERRN